MAVHLAFVLASEENVGLDNQCLQATSQAHQMVAASADGKFRNLTKQMNHGHYRST